MFRRAMTLSLRPLSSMAGVSKAPRVLENAPNFSGKAVVNGEVKDIKLSDFSGKYLVLFFYPQDFTGVCSSELTVISDRYKEFEEAGAAVVGVSTDSQFSHTAWNKQKRDDGGLGGLKFPLLADYHKKISADYGILNENFGFALRGQFLIDKKGVLRHITVNEPHVARSIDELLRLVKAHKFVDESGDACPAKWKPE